MNWYRFKVELFAVASGTLFLTLSALVLMAFSADLTQVTLNHPVWMRPAAEYREVVFAGFTTALALMWLCRWQAFRMLRNRQAYGER